MFITFEGGEGSGKSSAAVALATHIRKTHPDTVLTNDPGGCEIANQIRKVLLTSKNHNMSQATDMLLYQAARAQLTEEIIIPALNKNKIVICDRYYDSTTVYQGDANGWDLKILRVLRDLVDAVTPNLTFILDVDVRIGLKRSFKKASTVDVDETRYENKDHTFHNTIRNGFLQLAEMHSHLPLTRKFIVINTDELTLPEVHQRVIQKYETFIE